MRFPCYSDNSSAETGRCTTLRFVRLGEQGGTQVDRGNDGSGANKGDDGDDWEGDDIVLERIGEVVIGEGERTMKAGYVSEGCASRCEASTWMCQSVPLYLVR